MQREIAYRYIGGGIVVDLPARDIYADEAEYCELAELNIKNAGKPVYERAKKTAKTKEQPSEPKADEG